jgi:hypothetical protein
MLNGLPAPGRALVVFSHRRWSFVFGRPQQLLSRLAGRWRVVFIEEPLQGQTARLDVGMHGPNLSVVVPRTPLAQVASAVSSINSSSSAVKQRGTALCTDHTKAR